MLMLASGVLAAAPSVGAAQAPTVSRATDWHLEFSAKGSTVVWDAKPRFLQVAVDTPVARARAIHHGDAYYTRLTIHRIGSYAMLPLFAAEYVAGQKLLNAQTIAPWVSPTHRMAAGAIATLFAVNTVTGIWNFWEGRKDPGSARRLLHMALMLASDAGFVYTGTLAGGRRRFGGTTTNSRAIQHKNAAMVSIGLSTVGSVMMWIWKN